MPAPILLTKLFIPTQRPELVSRSHLIEQLNRGLHRKLTLISAPAGFGKTTLITEWLISNGDDASSPFLVAWFSLDEGDNDVVRFLTYLISSLKRVQGFETDIGDGVFVGHMMAGNYGHALGAAVAVGHVNHPEGVTPEFIRSGHTDCEL